MQTLDQVGTRGDSPQDVYTAERIAHWEAVAEHRREAPFWTRYYHRQIEALYKFLIPPGQRVLEIGCGRGDLLAAVEPSHGLGIDFSARRIDQARRRHPHL